MTTPPISSGIKAESVKHTATLWEYEHVTHGMYSSHQISDGKEIVALTTGRFASSAWRNTHHVRRIENAIAGVSLNARTKSVHALDSNLTRVGIAEEATRMNPSGNVIGHEIRPAPFAADGSTPSPAPTSESSLQEPGGFVAWLTFHAIAVYTSVSYWLRFKRVCAWHQPKQIRMGGNPLARKVTHGMCPECFARTSAEILKHQ